MRVLLFTLSLALAACEPRAPQSANGEPSAPTVKRFEVRTFSGSHANGTLAVAFLPGGKQAISSGVDEKTHIWDVLSGVQAKVYSGTRYRFQSIAVTPDGKFALTPAPDGLVNYWNVATGELQRTFTGGTTLGTVALCSDGKWAAGGGQDSAIHLWDFFSSSGAPVRELPANAPVLRLAFAGQNLYAVLGDGRLCAWTFESQQPPRCSEAIAEPVSSAAFSRDVRRVLIGSRYGTLLLWDTEKSAEIRKLTGVQSDVGAVAISPGGDRALSGGADKTLRLWNLDTGHETASAPAPGDYVSSVAFAPDGSSGIFGTGSGAVALWQLH